MERETDCEVKRNPGQVEQRHRTEAGEIRANGIEIAQRLRAIAAGADPQRQSHQGVVDAAAQRFIERATDAHQNASANGIENAQRCEQGRGQHQQADERGHAAAGQHTVINFQHEHRASEHENIAHPADNRGAIEGAAARRERLRQLRANGGLFSVRLATLHRLVPDEARTAVNGTNRPIF